MIVAVLLLIAVATLIPLALVLCRTPALRDRDTSARALHTAQLGELDRDLAEGRIGTAEHAAGVLEVQRRILATGNPPPPPPRAGRWPVAAALVLVPLAATGLYLIGGRPELGATAGAQRAAMAEQARQVDALIAALRTRLATVAPGTDTAREGYVLLGNAEAGRGHFADAAAAWRTALAVKFDATLAAQAAELQSRADGHVSDASAALFRRALAEAPPDAPWRKLAEERLGEDAGPVPPKL